MFACIMESSWEGESSGANNQVEDVDETSERRVVRPQCPSLVQVTSHCYQSGSNVSYHILSY